MDNWIDMELFAKVCLLNLNIFHVPFKERIFMCLRNLFFMLVMVRFCTMVPWAFSIAQYNGKNNYVNESLTLVIIGNYRL